MMSNDCGLPVTSIADAPRRAVSEPRPDSGNNVLLYDDDVVECVVWMCRQQERRQLGRAV
jgi:hypothetical protein